MFNLSRVTENVSKNHPLIIGIVIVFSFTSILFALRQKQATGGARAHCLKGYVCQMMSKNLSR